MKALVVNLSLFSDEGDLIADISRDEEFTKRLFGDLNHDFLRPPDSGKIIILGDSDEEEMREEKATDAEVAPSSVARSSAPTASADDADKGDTPDWVIGGSNSVRDEAGLP
jgi:hypothetical protein